MWRSIRDSINLILEGHLVSTAWKYAILHSAIFHSAVLLLFLSAAGCITDSTMVGTVIHYDSKGSLVPLAGGRILLVKGDLPGRLRKELTWWDEALVCLTGGEKEKLSDLTDEVAVVSFFSDSLLPETVDTKSWCASMADRCRQEGENCRKKSSSLLGRYSEFSTQAAKLKAMQKKNLQMSKDLERKSHESLELGKQRKGQAEEALRQAESQYSLYRGAHYSSKRWISEAMNELSSSDYGCYVADYCLDEANRNSQTAGMHINAANSWLAAAERCYRESEIYTRRAEEQQRKSDSLKLAADNYGSIGKAHELLAEEYGKKMKEYDKEAGNSQNMSARYSELYTQHDGSLTTEALAAAVSPGDSVTNLLGRLSKNCRVSAVKEIPSWYRENHKKIAQIFEERLAGESPLSESGQFGFSHVPDGDYYLIVPPCAYRNDCYMVKKIIWRGKKSKVIVSDDHTYSLFQNGVLRRGMAPFIPAGYRAAGTSHTQMDRKELSSFSGGVPHNRSVKIDAVSDTWNTIHGSTSSPQEVIR